MISSGGRSSNIHNQKPFKSSRRRSINNNIDNYTSSSPFVSPPSFYNRSHGQIDAESINSNLSYETNNSTLATTVQTSNSSPSKHKNNINNKSHQNWSFDEFNPTDDFNVHSSYQLTKLDTRFSIDSYVAEKSHQFKIELNLSQSEIELIRYTWEKMLLEENQSSRNLPGSFNQKKPSSTTANAIASSLFCRQFYSNLLSMDPDLEKLFPSIKHQAVSFAGVMNMTISQLENLSVLNEYLEKLGKRHSRILNIEPPNFELMGEALIQTFHERFGTRFNQQLEVLWIKLYMYLSNSILQFGIDPVLTLQKIESGSTSSLRNFKSQRNASYTTNDASSISNSLGRSISNTSSTNEQASSNTHTTKKNSLLSNINLLSSSSSSTKVDKSRTTSDNVKANKSMNIKSKASKRSRINNFKKSKDNCVIM